MHYFIPMSSMAFRCGVTLVILINAIQILQNRVVHLITYNDDFPLIPGPLPASNPIFYKLELLKIKELFILMNYIFIYKCLNTSLLPLFEGWFKYSSSIHEYKTRSNYNTKSEVSQISLTGCKNST